MLVLLNLSGFACQFVMCLTQHSDIARHPQHTDQGSVLAVHRAFYGFQQLGTAIMQCDVFFIDHRAAGCNGPSVMQPEMVRQCTVNKVVIGFADYVGLSGTEETFKPVVTGKVAALFIFQPDKIRQGIQQRLQVVTSLLKLLVGLLQLCILPFQLNLALLQFLQQAVGATCSPGGIFEFCSLNQDLVWWFRVSVYRC